VSTSQAPEGLLYEPEFITPEEEVALIAALEGLDFEEVRMHGQTARRTVRHFGYDYDYEGRQLTACDPLPEDLRWLRERSARLAGLGPEELAQTLVSRYPPGAGIGWHRDAPMFGPRIVGVSFGSRARMRFQRKVRRERQTYALELAPRSAYVLSGAARSSWQHSIPPAKSLRYSVTFRTVKSP
jgi:DNA oxidative demethylase